MANNRNTFTFEWRIEKFRYFVEVEPAYCVLSSEFYIMPMDAGIWKLELYPNGRFQGDPYMGLTLKSLSDTGVVYIGMNCEWSVLGRDGSFLFSKTLKNVATYGECTIPLPDGPMTEHVFVTRKSEFLPLGTFTLRVRLWGSRRDLPENEYILGCTKVDIRKDSFRWRLCRFNSLQLKRRLENYTGYNLAPHSKHPVVTNLTLMGESLEDSTVTFEIHFRELTRSLWIKVKLWVLDSDFKVIKSYAKSRIFQKSRSPDTAQSWIIQNLVSRREIVTKCLLNDLLTIRFKVYLIPQYSSFIESARRGGEKKETSIKCGSSSRNGDGHVISPERTNSMNALSEDFLLAFKNHTLSDFELRSGATSFPAHKFVLNARSPYFRDMFSADPNQLNFMDVSDLDPNTLEMLLRFLYSGVIVGLQWEGAIKLYCAADQLRVPSLKWECWDVLMADITVKNVSEVLKLADKLQDTVLTSCAKNFITEHIEEIVHSAEWEEFLAENPNLLEKTLSEIYKKNSEEDEKFI